MLDPRACSVAYLERFRNDPPEFRRVGVSLHGVGFPGASLANSMVGQPDAVRHVYIWDGFLERHLLSAVCFMRLKMSLICTAYDRFYRRYTAGFERHIQSLKHAHYCSKYRTNSTTRAKKKKKKWAIDIHMHMHCAERHLGLHLTIREDRSVVSLQNGLYQRRPADFIYSLLSRPVSENGVEEEALRGFPCISARVTHDYLSPVFFCLSDAASPAQRRANIRSQGSGSQTTCESDLSKGTTPVD